MMKMSQNLKVSRQYGLVIACLGINLENSNYSVSEILIISNYSSTTHKSYRKSISIQKKWVQKMWIFFNYKQNKVTLFEEKRI